MRLSTQLLFLLLIFANYSVEAKARRGGSKSQVIIENDPIMLGPGVFCKKDSDCTMLDEKLYCNPRSLWWIHRTYPGLIIDVRFFFSFINY